MKEELENKIIEDEILEDNIIKSKNEYKTSLKKDYYILKKSLSKKIIFSILIFTLIFSLLFFKNRHFENNRNFKHIPIEYKHKWRKI